MSERRADHHLLRQAGGGLLWGLFFILAPFEVLFLGALVWVPILIWREKRRTRLWGFWPGVIYRFAVVAGFVALAAFAPTKHEDQRVGPLRRDVSLGELVSAGIIYQLFETNHHDLRVSLPSPTPSRREVMEAITRQTGFRTHVYHCAHGATILFGSGGGAISVTER
jgi:hypothetical protein